MPNKNDVSKSRRSFLKDAAVSIVPAITIPAALAGSNTADELPSSYTDAGKYLGVGVAHTPYGAPSRFEEHVQRRTLKGVTATSQSSVSFSPLQNLHGFVTPNGLCFERHHAGVAQLNPEGFKLMVHGLVEKPLNFTLDDLKRFPAVNKFHFLECSGNGAMEWHAARVNSLQISHGMIHCVQYTGVTLGTLLNECGLKNKAKWLLAEGADASGLTRSIPIGKALDDCMVAYAMNGEMLRAEQGYPLRLVVPGWEGNMWVKWLKRLEVGAAPWHTREETSKYTDLMPNGKARQFSWLMEAKSVITSPCPEHSNLKHGQNRITGLAWSGRGKVSRVDISLDGGINWQHAELEGPVMSKCLSRFNFDWNWAGQPALLQSRVVDETGYVQPSYKELRSVRGTNSFYHNNAIQTWRISTDGEVDNVQLS